MSVKNASASAAYIPNLLHELGHMHEMPAAFSTRFGAMVGAYEAPSTGEQQHVAQLITDLLDTQNTLAFVCKPNIDIPGFVLQDRRFGRGQRLVNPQDRQYNSGEINGMRQVTLRGQNHSLLTITHPDVADGATSYVTIPDLAHYTRQRIDTFALTSDGVSQQVESQPLRRF